MDTLQCMRMFVEAVREESLSAAARKLGVSTATVSRGLDALERHLGFRLLVKTSRQLGLTEAGEAYLHQVERFILELDDATEFARGFQSEAEGLLRVHARTAVGSICVSPLLPEFLRLYPKLKINFSLTNDKNIDLIRHNIDVDIRTGVLDDSSLIARKLAASHRVIVASPSYIERYGAPQTPYDLTQHNCITYRPDSNPVFWRFRNKAGCEIEISPEGSLMTDNGGVIRNALRSGLGIGHMTDWSVAEDLRSGRLVALLSDYEVTVDKFNHGIYAVFLPSRNHSRKVRAFIDFMADAFKTQAYFRSPASLQESAAHVDSSAGLNRATDDPAFLMCDFPPGPWQRERSNERSKRRARLTGTP
jgi:DNA-binding transcriptional LysR family regulator